ncbi:MAG: AbrB/MazE/SpoVT family DNA-binding domain-containing protein [Spirochaetota bacterium]
MLCKVTTKNQITLPKEIMRQFGEREYFDARIEGGRIVLEPMIVRPVVTSLLGKVREKIRAQGIEEKDLARLVDEARHADGA